MGPPSKPEAMDASDQSGKATQRKTSFAAPQKPLQPVCSRWAKKRSSYARCESSVGQPAPSGGSLQSTRDLSSCAFEASMGRPQILKCGKVLPTGTRLQAREAASIIRSRTHTCGPRPEHAHQGPW